MSRSIQLADVSRHDRCLAPNRRLVKAASETNARAQNSASVNYHEGEASGSYQTYSQVKDDFGKRTALIQLDGRTVPEGRRSFVAFSRDAKLCIVCDRDRISVWETTKFSQLCCRTISNGQKIVNVSFCADSSSRFLAFFADLSMSVFLVKQNNELNHSFLLRESDSSVNPKLSNGWDLSNAKKVALISDVEMQKTFTHLAEIPEQGLLLCGFR